jgi:carboxylesterase type B
MVGSPNFEGMFFSLFFNGFSGKLDEYNKKPFYLVPATLGLTESFPNIDEVIQELKNLYFGGRDEGTLVEWLKVYSDGVFRINDDRIIRYVVNEDQPVYHYEFAFDGSLNFFKKNLSLQNFEGASHGDELFYLFEPDIEGFIPDEKSSLIRNRMVKLWTNFAKFG